MAERVLFVGDVHLDPHRRDVRDRFVRFLDRVVPGASELHVLGDLFEHWVSPRQAEIPFYEDVLLRLRDVAERGTALHFLPGNRDFLLTAEVAARGGMRTWPLWRQLRLGDEIVLITHGDLLCARDRPYQRMRALLRLPFLSWLSRAMPLWAAVRLGDRMRGVSRKAVAGKDPAIRDLDPRTVRRMFRGGYRDVLICGHVHRPRQEVHRVDGRERTLLVVPEWSETAGWIEWEAGRWRLVRDAY